ncbi:MAG: coniferyl aldehyde dehydrogenase [Pseudomonadota bacterium]
MHDMAFDSKMQNVLAHQKQSFLDNGAPDAAQRIDRMNRAIDLLVTHQQKLQDAVSSDFGHRSQEATAFSDIAPGVMALKHARSHLKKWMRPEKRRSVPPLGLLGASARVEFQPKGVVGIIAPWNFPVGMVFTPLAGVFAAGNSAMIKPSEYTEETSKLMAELIHKAFDETEAYVFTGGPEVGRAFSSLPFDHLLFTGGTQVGRSIMKSAAENLTPVTLELGGKSPVFIGRSADMKKTAARIMAGKTLNAGQICLAPDYIFVPRDKIDMFVAEARVAVADMYPSGLLNNEDYTSVVNERHFSRLHETLDDARDKGAEIIILNPRAESFADQPHHKMPPTIILGATDDMRVMQEEIFGPLLPVKPYDDIADAIKYVNDRDRPLSLYYFGEDSGEEKALLARTTSGGVTVNDVIFHNGQEDLPFGGIGPSGMGAYHGRDGFLEFSHKKAVFRQARGDFLKMLRPPYGSQFRWHLKQNLRR